MHNITVKGILSAQNGMNLYRGCTHGCIYCDSRSSCYQMDHPFEDVAVKENALSLLEDALRRKRKRCMIATGSMSDPYLPLEASLRHTRRALELIERYGFGASLITKSDLVLRDLDLLTAINQNAKCVVQMTLTTYDESLCRILEPHVATTKRRVEVLERLKEHGIPTVVWLCPILPYLNDTEENLRGLLSACATAGVYGILCYGMGLTLRQGNREYFYEKLDQHFPGLKYRYQREFGTAYQILSPRNGPLMELFEKICQQHQICTSHRAIFSYLGELEEPRHSEQLCLFDSQSGACPAE